MLGYPQGWVTDTPTIRRTVMLRLLGNSVQSQQAEYALRLLLERIETGVNAA